MGYLGLCAFIYLLGHLLLAFVVTNADVLNHNVTFRGLVKNKADFSDILRHQVGVRIDKVRHIKGEVLKDRLLDCLNESKRPFCEDSFKHGKQRRYVA